MTASKINPLHTLTFAKKKLQKYLVASRARKSDLVPCSGRLTLESASCTLSSYSLTGCSWTSCKSEASGNTAKWLPSPKNLGLKNPQVFCMFGSRVTPWSSPWPPTDRTGCSWPSCQSEASVNNPKWFLLPKNLGFEKKACLWHAWKLSYSMKSSLTSYRPHRLFLTFMSILGLWK